MLFVSLPTGGYQEGYEIYGPANMIYAPGQPLQIGADVINPATVTNLQLQKIGSTTTEVSLWLTTIATR